METDELFEEIMIQEAARDRRLQGLIEWELFGETDKVGGRFLDLYGDEEVSRDIQEHFGLSPAAVSRVFAVARELVVEENALNHGVEPENG